ncbi:MAG: hypothetical protein RR825_07205 [Ruthenibacterium sp.]
MKILSALMLAVLMALSLAGCAATAPAAGDATADAKTDFKIGIIQLTQHAALDQLVQCRDQGQGGRGRGQFAGDAGDNRWQGDVRHAHARCLLC